MHGWSFHEWQEYLAAAFFFTKASPGERLRGPNAYWSLFMYNPPLDKISQWTTHPDPTPPCP